ncbi:hypothetical protein dqs_0581 [Azoarcus olearius]|nr:hypothetical protein dqs_0581 [Azoarcus olearius]
MDDDDLIDLLRDAFRDAGTAINIGGTWVAPTSDDLPRESANDAAWPDHQEQNGSKVVPLIARTRAGSARNVHFPAAVAIPLTSGLHAASGLVAAPFSLCQNDHPPTAALPGLSPHPNPRR